VMYGDTSEPQLLQTTKRSGPLAMYGCILRRPMGFARRIVTYGTVAATISRITSA
jgi:hypothetical protein